MLHPNSFKYLKAPSWEQIKKVVDAHGATNSQFERFYGMAKDTLNKTYVTDRSFPVKYWHIVYECLRLIEGNKPLPQYKDEQPQPAESIFSMNIPFFKKGKKKKPAKKNRVKRTGSLCELC